MSLLDPAHWPTVLQIAFVGSLAALILALSALGVTLDRKSRADRRARRADR